MAKGWKPGGQKGKLHREIGVPEGKKIPASKLAAAEKSDNPEIRRDAIRAKTMEGWRHGNGGSDPEARKRRRETMYTHPTSKRIRDHG